MWKKIPIIKGIWELKQAIFLVLKGQNGDGENTNSKCVVR